MSARTGWFAACGGREDPEWQRSMWQPCLETGTGHIPCFDVWFNTEAECVRYIREEIIPIAGRMTPHAAHLAAQRPTPAPTEES